MGPDMATQFLPSNALVPSTYIPLTNQVITAPIQREFIGESQSPDAYYRSQVTQIFQKIGHMVNLQLIFGLSNDAKI